MTLLHEVTSLGVSMDRTTIFFKDEKVLDGRIERKPQLHFRGNLKHQTIYVCSTTYSWGMSTATSQTPRPKLLHLPQLVRQRIWVPNCNIVEDFTVHQNCCENAILPDEKAVINWQSLHGYSQLGWSTAHFGRNFYGLQDISVGHEVTLLFDAMR